MVVAQGMLVDIRIRTARCSSLTTPSWWVACAENGNPLFFAIFDENYINGM